MTDCCCERECECVLHVAIYLNGGRGGGFKPLDHQAIEFSYKMLRDPGSTFGRDNIFRNKFIYRFSAC